MPTMRNAAMLLATMTGGCAPMVASAETPPLEGTAWTLSSLPGHDLGSSSAPTLRFEDGRASGSDGCNRYSMPFVVKGGRLDLSGPAMSTEMACAPEVMKRAAAYVAALQGSTGYRIRDGQLELLGDDGSVRLTLAARSQSLTGTSWRASGINNGKKAVASVVLGSEVTIAFGPDGRASGSAGCNSFTAGYEASAPQLKFTAPASTRKMCANAEVMRQEQAFLAALQTVATMRFEGDRLELRRADGALAVALMRDKGK
jgi:heat shock protein HslJ